VLPESSIGKIEASTTRRPSMLCTQSSLSATVIGSLEGPIFIEPTG
jgi:hypothetical protein